MSSRDDILTRVRRNQPAPRQLPEIPMFDAGRSASLATFSASLERMGGRVLAPAQPGELNALVSGLFPDAKIVCSAAPEVTGNRRLQDIEAPQDLADVDVGVVRALFGVAETGSLWLSEQQFGENALGFLSQHLVVLLDPEALVVNLHHAYHHSGFAAARYAVLMTGPSATADIEGVLIHGAQGIRTLTVVPVAGNHAA
jgi:L-lactate dehydrogenase complex protein LldG